MTAQELYDKFPANAQSGLWKIEKTTENNMALVALIELRNNENWHWMTNRENELSTHQVYLDALDALPPNSSVLIGGLGLNYDGWCAVERPNVDRVVVIEMESDIINLVQPHITDNKTEIIESRLGIFLTNNTELFDLIWIDIFDVDSAFYQPEVNQLTEMSSNSLKPGGKLLFWRQFGPLEL